MEKTATLNLRLNSDVKRNAEAVLSSLGLSMSAAITIYLKQIALHGGIPFDLKLPKGPNSLNTDLMSAEEVRSFIDKGLDDIDKDKVVKAKKFFEDFRSTHAND